MKWTKTSASKIKDPSVRKRVLEELSKSRTSPVTGSEDYWRRIVEHSQIDHRLSPELYSIGKGQQGVLSVEPYKSEILPYWSFKDPISALVSADTIYQIFLSYLRVGDFVGADMSKKFLHMGFTRSRRYANHSSGRKYGSSGSIIPQENSNLSSQKAFSAEIFKLFWDEARQNPLYLELRGAFKAGQSKR